MKPSEPTIQLPHAMQAWGTADFPDVLKQEIAQLGLHQLPLQQGLSRSSHVLDRPIQALIHNAHEEADLIRVKIGVFYSGVIAGCSCADDPTPIDEQTEYCVIQLGINKLTAATTVTLLEE